MKRLLIAGCGDLGLRLARVLEPSRWTVTGLRRNPQALNDRVAAVGADLNRPESLQPVAGPWDAVIYQATPSERSPEGYRLAYVDGLVNLLARVEPTRLILVSSTSVYGQDAGEVVDERSATEPARYNGQLLLEGEQVARTVNGISICVRFSGIYGPGRDRLLRQLRSGQARCREAPPQWTNRIHADDCAGVLAHLLELERPAGLYCASDSRPAPRCEVLDWLAGQLKAAPVQRDATAAGGQGKRVRNQRLLASGYALNYPDFKAGYGALLR
jgi:nucleoside-diphosphate-sugar epimerase